MQDQFLQYIILGLLLIGLVMLANKLKLPYPIVLVLGGLAISFSQMFSHVTIDPELIFFIFLPPLLYEAAWQISWREFWKYRRVIISFAFPIVIITSCVVAFASNAFIPGFTLALGFLLGGIVSPPDAISATTIMRKLKAPKILLTVAEGESLLNDASALIVFRFALAAIVTGQFRFTEAAGNFFLVVVAGTAIGICVGFIFYAIHRWLPTTPSIEIVLTFITPYCMYYAAEHFHFSGVLAVVSGGLLLSGKRDTLLSPMARVQGVNVWNTIGFVLNGVVFLLIGLQLPAITSELQEVTLGEAIWYGLLICIILILTRLCCTLGAAAFTRVASRFIKVADRRPGWRIPVVFGWAGMRGVVSLAAALSIPVMIQEGQPFPHRNLILLITFVVILVTLVFQGLTLPWVMRKLGVTAENQKDEETQELEIRKAVTEASMKFLRASHTEPIRNHRIQILFEKLNQDWNAFRKDLDEFNSSSRKDLIEYHEIYLKVLEEQRKVLNQLKCEDGYDEEVIRKYLAIVDIEETKLRELMI